MRRAVLFAIASACGGHPAAPPPRVTIAPLPTVVIAPPVASAKPPAPPQWPAAVDLALTAPDGFHLVAVRGDEALVTVTGMLEFREPNLGNALVHGNTEYTARFDLRTGCMLATYDFPTIGAAARTGTVKDALAILASPAMAAEIARAKTITSTFGPNDAPIRVTPDGRNAVLEANNEIYWAKDGGAHFTHLPGIGKSPLVSSDGAHLLYGSGGIYQPMILDFATGRTRAVTRGRAKAMSVSDVYPLADGTFLSVETNGFGVQHATQVCVMTIDPKRAIEAQAVCVPSDVISASVSELSADSRFVAVHAEHMRADRILTFDTKTWQKVTDAPGSPNYMDVDDRGRVAWDDYSQGPKKRIVVAEGGSVKPLAVPAGPHPDIPPTFVGFLGHRMIVGYPSIEAFATTGLRTLRDVAPCGHLRVIDAP